MLVLIATVINRLFEKIDRNRDSCISQSELKELIMNIKFVKASMEVEEAVALIIEELDLNRDHIINEEEFVAGFEKWLSSTSSPAPLSNSESQEDIYQVSVYPQCLSKKYHQLLEQHC